MICSVFLYLLCVNKHLKVIKVFLKALGGSKGKIFIKNQTT